ncbi:MAG: copper oxidase [Desulfobacteraceae bacterium]|nr:MAG: copper oxidase [Desulfobacteraceae bacterium]
MMTRRQMLKTGALALAGGAVGAAFRHADAAEQGSALTRPPLPAPKGAGYTPVVTLNGWSLPWKMEKDVKVFHLVAEPVKREFAPGMVVNCWGYNGSTPGPTIEAVEGDRIRILVTNRLPEHTTIHWHGIFLPNGMDGVGGLTQPHIKPGETYVYEYTLRQNGTFMYHPHADEMVQMALGMYGMLIVHPRTPEPVKIHRDYCFMLHNFAVHAGTATPDPSVMTDFNMWTFNSRVFPGIDPLVARTGDRVRIRIANLSMHEHPIHIHGTAFEVTGTDAGWIPSSARYKETSLLVPVGNIRVGEFIADAPGDWALHCHKSHHTMNAMGHEIANMIGVKHDDIARRIRKLVPGYMAMGETGMAEHAAHTAVGHMPLPENTLPMMTGEGPFGTIEMGGMFTMVKVRDNQKPGDYTNPGWYEHPGGTVAWKLQGQPPAPVVQEFKPA